MCFSVLSMWKPIRIGTKCKQVLNILKERKVVSGEELSYELHCSRTAIWKCIKRLKELRYQISSSPRSGYELLSVPDIPYPWEMEEGFTLFHNFLYFEEIDSTNIKLFSMAKEGAPEGTVLIANRQLRGRGRCGRVWISPPGNIYMSILIKPQCKAQDGTFITLLSGVAVACAIRECGVSARVKWPNDIVVKNKKLCGILCESELENGNINFMVVGIGVNMILSNIHLPELKNAISLSECGVNMSRRELIRAILKQFERLYSAFLEGRKEDIRKMYLEISLPKGKVISIKTEKKIIRGRFWDVDRDGAIVILDNEGKRRKIYSAEVL